MNYSEKKWEAVKDFLMSIDDDDIFSMCNNFAEDCCDGAIFVNNDETLNDIFDSPSEVIRAVTYGNYSYWHKYMMFDGNGNLESADYLCNLIDFEELADWVIRNDPHEIHRKLEDTLRDEFLQLFTAEHPNADIEDNLYDYDIIGEDWNNLAIEVEAELDSDSE